MLKSISKLSFVALLAAAVAAMPLTVLAQSTNTPAPATKKHAAAKAAKAEKTDKAEGKKAIAGPFHGKLAALDKVAKTITVGTRTFQITSETKIFKGDKPALFEDGVINDEVSGYVKPTADGKLNATKLTYGPVPKKAEKATKPKAKAKAKTPKKDKAAKTETEAKPVEPPMVPPTTAPEVPPSIPPVPPAPTPTTPSPAAK
jgi:hypothetical protein